MSAVLNHLRRNVVAYVALFVALGGTGYAATHLARGSVGARELKNNSITPVKFNKKFINGSVRAWAIVGSGGRLIGGGGKPKVRPAAFPGEYVITWGVTLRRNCATIATIDSEHSPTTEQLPPSGHGGGRLSVTAGYAVAASSGMGSGHQKSSTLVDTYKQDGKRIPLGFDVAIVC